MNKEINQKISQFLDDELDHAELDDFLLKIKQQPQLKNTMNRYYAISHLLSGKDVLIADVGFLDKVGQEIEQEPYHFLSKRSIKRSIKLRSFGFWSKASVAMVASFAIIAAIVSQQINVTTIQAPQILVKNKSIKEGTAIKTAKSSQHERFKAYLQAHSDDIYTHGSLSYQPLARVVNFSSNNN
ncbi:MAG: sigma-E factor negative regulatory protein [Methylococcales symbiont of Iophon sp. n. MRB-2018]|nr:MAG: sigma-E factor negative regulatory protein [Methylococcales symbiont of Iophon sp. n. MRB-2018]KAF3979796.1 MAG: sigma-E factor negative regulatory protein [Methylococcales symbiont of Iophon sp. n. MRB-2018]